MSLVQLLALLLTIISLVHGYALVRTYSNWMETLFLAIGLALPEQKLLPPNDFWWKDRFK